MIYHEVAHNEMSDLSGRPLILPDDPYEVNAMPWSNLSTEDFDRADMLVEELRRRGVSDIDIRDELHASYPELTAHETSELLRYDDPNQMEML